MLAHHPQIDGLLFTGSFDGGVALNRAVVDDPGKIIALELGGNNQLVIGNISDPRAAAYWTIQSAFLTAGQRCTCARRLIVPDSAAGEAFIARLVELGLLAPSGATPLPSSDDLPAALAAASEPLNVSVHDDLADLITVDPIHEVEEPLGWPAVKQVS
jgi:acyl-CoA reductase-like NAD-dependent aldehyde dehydrogenase